MNRRGFLKAVGWMGAMLPTTVLAQNANVHVVGVLSATGVADIQISSFKSGLADRGYVEGRDLTLLLRSADGDFDKLPALAADLIRHKVAVIVAMNSPVPARVARAATATIPIVFAYGGDPVGDNLVSNLSRPGGNVTGATFIGAELSGKLLGLLNEIAPGLADVGILVSPKGTLAESQINDARIATQRTGQRLHVVKASSPNEIDAAFAELGTLNVGGLIVGTDPTLLLAFRKKIIELAARYKIATIYGATPAVKDGGLIGYSADPGLTWRQSGIYVGRILNGDKPADLPVVQPTRFELVVNLKTAKALGLSIPEAFLLRADQVFE